MNTLFGMRVVPNEFAVRSVVTFEVQRWPIRKRRRGWHVVRVEHREPMAYLIGESTWVMHPALISRLHHDAAVLLGPAISSLGAFR
jgi:hypothetical protein